MTKEETIKIKKTTFILAIVIIIAILAALGSVYYINTNINTKKNTDKITTEEVLSMEPVELDATAIIVRECSICLNMSEVMQELKQTPFIILRQSSIIYASSEEAKQLIAKYNIKKLPTLFLQGETKDLPLRGFKEVEDGVILEDVPPPYVDLDKKDIMGLVDITYLTDNTCKECYDAKQHREIMELAFRVYIQNEKTIDVNSIEGAEILQKYDITKVPTILLSSETKEYQTVGEVWNLIGTVEEDGVYVFRGFDMTQDIVYKDLETGKLINTSQMNNE